MKSDWQFDPRRHAVEQIDRLAAQAARMADLLDEIESSAALADHFAALRTLANAADDAESLAERLSVLRADLGLTPAEPARYTDDERREIVATVCGDPDCRFTLAGRLP